MKKILIIAAHPDDEILGMGGTAAKYATAGYEVALLIVTDGSTSQYKNHPELEKIIENKKKETRNASKIIGISRIYYGDLPDMRLDVTPHTEINGVIEKVLNDFKPNVVYTHFEGDINKDHQCVFQSTIVACRPFNGQSVKEIYSYSVPSSTEWNIQNSKNVFTPNVFIDISGEFAKKKYMAMQEYHTELRDYPHPRSIKVLETLDKSVGLQVGLEYAESFILHRCIK